METLFHYTNIETLALILKNRTIRFNPLNKMDDLEENLSADVYNAGMFTYVSCWTSSKKENIALWKQYTHHDTGVRIELPVYPFKEYIARDLIDDQRIKNLFSEKPDTKTIIRLDKMLKSNYFTQIVTGHNILFKMNYTDNEDDIIPKIVHIDVKKNVLSSNFSKIGKYKREAWKYQEEWRYMIQFYPGNLLTIYKDDGLMLRNAFINVLAGKEKQPFSYYDLEIDDKAYKSMKIVLSPTITLGNEILVRNVVEKYNFGIEISESAFKGKIR